MREGCHSGRVTDQTVAGQTVVASANILRDLRASEARAALAGLLELRPDLIGLQEWGPKRLGLLREASDYAWSWSLLGGCAIGARKDRYDVLAERPEVLTWPGRADKPDRPFGIEPARIARLGRYLDRATGNTVVLITFHLVPGVQSNGHYREDRPKLVARHRAEVRRLEQLIAAEQARGHVVHAVGDTNAEGVRLTGLTSAWEGADDPPATLDDGRTIDDVFGPGPATSVVLLDNPSDHRAVVAYRSGTNR